MKTHMELSIMMAMVLHVKEGRIELIFNCLFQLLSNFLLFHFIRYCPLLFLLGS
jgi:hypothetical protein